MSFDAMTNEVAEAVNVTEEEVTAVIEEFLMRLHRLEFERDHFGSDFVSEVRWGLSSRSLYHLLGFIDSFASEGDRWEPGTIVEYLGRMPPTEVWKELAKEMTGWTKGRRA